MPIPVSPPEGGVPYQIIITTLITISIALLGWLISLLREIKQNISKKQDSVECGKMATHLAEIQDKHEKELNYLKEKILLKRKVSDCEKIQENCINIRCGQICQKIDEIKVDRIRRMEKIEKEFIEMYNAINSHSHDTKDGRTKR